MIHGRTGKINQPASVEIQERSEVKPSNSVTRNAEASEGYVC
jgi:hypothetical protein